MLGNCVVCKDQVAATVENRTAMYRIAGVARLLCFDCAVVKFENSPEKQMAGVFRAVYWLPENWEGGTPEERATKKTEMGRQFQEDLTRLLSVESRVEDAWYNITYNDRTMAWWRDDIAKVEEYRQKRLAGERPGIPPVESMDDWSKRKGSAA